MAEGGGEMSKTGSVFELEVLQDRASIGKYLAALKEGFEGGKIVLGTKSRKTILTPNELLRFQVKAKRKSGKVTLTIKCTWKEEVTEDSESDTLIIE
jgi:amphi-Trp domain-containing protein